MDMNEILEQLEAIQPKGPVWEDEKTFEALGSFQCSTEKDDAGIPFQDPSYIKRSCTNCNGRGAIILSSGGPRRWTACGCMIRGYRRARLAHEQKVARLKKAAGKVFKP